MNDISLYDLQVGDGPTTAPAAAAAGDDVSLYEVARYIQETLLGSTASTQTSDLHGKIGTDAEMNDISLYDLLVGAGPTTAPSAAAAGDDVSLYEVTRYIQETLLGSTQSTQTSDLHGKVGTDTQMADRSLYDLLVGDGPTTAPSSAAPANDVSMYEVLSSVYDYVANGSTFVVSKTLVHSTIVTAASDVTGASSGGALLIEDVVLCNDSTAMDSGGNTADLDFTVTNATYAAGAVFATVDDDGVAANATLSGSNGDFNTFYPVVLESGKKVQVAAGDEVFTSGGTLQINIKFRRMAAAATVAAA